jgi:hypothetical protein
MAHTLCKLAAAHEAVPTVMVTAAGTRELAGTLDIIIGISCRRTAAGSHDFGIKGGLQSEIWKENDFGNSDRCKREYRQYRTG